MPSQKSGTATPLIASAVPNLSAFELGRTAETIPTGTAIASATTMAIAVKWSVTGKRARSPSSAGSRVRIDRPRSPLSARPSHLAYCGNRLIKPELRPHGLVHRLVAHVRFTD